MIDRTLPPLVLASRSLTRQMMLRQAGLTITVQPPGLDETAFKAELRTRASAAPALAPELAGALARAKAEAVAQSQFLGPAQPSAWVIGADQVLSCDGELFDKASDLAAAKVILRRLQSRRHELHSAVCVIHHDERGNMVQWLHVSTAQLWMRPLSDDFITGYLDRAGPSVLWSVGCYQIEGLGTQLFERVEGDHFTILGLPLLPLLHYLRTAGRWPI
jgi:septum formation protein